MPAFDPKPTADASRFKLGTFSAPGAACAPGVVIDDQVIMLVALAPLAERVNHACPFNASSLLGVLDQWATSQLFLADAARLIRAGEAHEVAGHLISLQGLRHHAPLMPRQIFCSGANYKKHVVELFVAQTFHLNEHLSAPQRLAEGWRMMDERATSGTPFFFVKAQSTLAGPFDAIMLPIGVEQPDWELELGVVIGKSARHVSREQALEHVAGYMVVNDITSRDRVNRKDMKELGMDWVASKCSPTFLPTGPYLVPASTVGDPQSLQLVLKLNGETMQNESTADMIFGVARLIESLSATCLLQPGDLICTGSPAGNGMHYKRFLRPGDILEGSIGGLGTQRNICVAETLAAR